MTSCDLLDLNKIPFCVYAERPEVLNTIYINEVDGGVQEISSIFSLSVIL